MDQIKLKDMQQAVPDSTDAERQRFLAVHKGDSQAAAFQLKKYLSWRQKHCDRASTNLDPWVHATQLAAQTSGEEGRKQSAQNDVDALKLPCILFLQEHEQSTGKTTVEKKKYLHLLPARIDTKLADSSIYALALAIYIDRALDRNSTETATLVIDVRSGHGWANIKATHLLPFIQSTARLLCDLYPRRLERCIVFPMPTVAKVLWIAAKPFLGTDTREKVCLVFGQAGRDDNAPKKLSEYLDEKLIANLEETRMSCFVR